MPVYTCEVVGAYGPVEVEVDSASPGQWADQTLQCWLPPAGETKANIRGVAFRADGSDPEPQPQPEPPVTEGPGQEVADFLGEPADANLVAMANQHIAMVTALARSYTRGNGFLYDDAGEPDLHAVIITATARLVTNPEQVKREDVGGYSVTPTPFLGWTLAETMVLNRYRRRSL